VSEFIEKENVEHNGVHMSTLRIEVPSLVKFVKVVASPPRGISATDEEAFAAPETGEVIAQVSSQPAQMSGLILGSNGHEFSRDLECAPIDAAVEGASAPSTPANELDPSISTLNTTQSDNKVGDLSDAPSSEFDLVVIGGGPGGYIAAIRAAQLGMTVACIEEWRNSTGKPKLGGTCLNVGCIPSKALLASSEHFEHTLHELGAHGVIVNNVSLDLAKMIDRKEAIVERITGGVEFLFRKNKVKWLKGHGRLAGKSGARVKVEVSGDDGMREVMARNVVIATGSKARHPKGVRIDNRLVVDNEGALSFDAVPQRLAIIGAGVIGLELGSVWRRLGAEVTILETMTTLLSAIDSSIASEAAKQFRKQGLTIHLSANVEEVLAGENDVTVRYKDQNGNLQTLLVDRLIACVGRVPYTGDLGLESVGLKTDERGFIVVDEHCSTAVEGIYAIGDVVRGPMLAHKAQDEGVMVAEIIDGQKPHIDYNCIPWVIYTDPEIAWVGKSEQQLRIEGRAIKVGQFPVMANGRAMGMGKTAGFVKMIADAKTDEILGVHIISVNASELIAEAVLAMEFRATSEDIGMISHPHPSLSEVMREAALAIQKRALNI
jgi:dihydrolipoamide dehydrogenase